MFRYLEVHSHPMSTPHPGSRNGTMLLSSHFELPSRLRAAPPQLTILRSNPVVRAVIYKACISALFDERGPEAADTFLSEIFEPLA